MKILRSTHYLNLLLLLLFVSAPVLTVSATASATASAQEDGVAPFFKVLEVTNNQSTLDLALYADGLNQDLNTVAVELLVDGQKRNISGEGAAQSNIQLAVVVDPYEINAPGASNETRAFEVATVMNGLVERLKTEPVLTPPNDQMAAYTLDAQGSLQTIWTWTNQPNELFNKIHENIVTIPIGGGATNNQLNSLLLQTMAAFPATPTPFVKTILLFSAGANQLDVSQVSAQAQQQGIHIHVVQLSNTALVAPYTTALQQLAQQTNGHFANYSTATQPEAIWRSLIAYHRLHRVSSISNDTAGAAQTLTVVLRLENGVVLEQVVPLATDPAAYAESNASQATAAEAQPAPAAVAQAPAEPISTTDSAAVIENDSADEPAIVEEPQPGDEAPPTQDATVYVTVPGTNFAIPRILLQLALPLLLLLLFYLVFREMRERRKGHLHDFQLPGANKPSRVPRGTNNPLNRTPAKPATPPPAADRNWSADKSEPLRPSAKEPQRKGKFPAAKPSKPSSFPSSLDDSDDFLGQEMPYSPPPNAASPFGRPASNGRYSAAKSTDGLGDPWGEDDDQATVVPLNLGDEEATYRLSDPVEQPIIGTLVRVSDNPTLPQRLPVYGLSATRGEARQIHIGRHSKNNTVIINDKSVSREHAVLIQKEGRLYLRDNASSAGTFLNWRRLQPGEELLLRHNDLIGFGEISYEFHAKGEDEATADNR